MMVNSKLFLALVTAALVAASPAISDRSEDAWDAIVVGAGAAGIIVADRLSQAGKRTLLLEGGGPSYGITGGTQRPEWLEGTNLSRVDVPGLYKSIFADQGNLTCGTLLNAFGGCTIGGNTAINAGLFFEPPASDYDLYYPRKWKSADMERATAKVYSRQSSTDNPSSDHIRYYQSGYDAAREWIVEGAGFSQVDLNRNADRKTKVFGRPIWNYHNGQRGGPVKTYLQSALKRSCFQLKSGTRVKRVLRSGDRATGVLTVSNNVEKTYKLRRNGRVILSGGALFSPQLLMLSGIGDPGVLNKIAAAGLLDDLSPSSWINNTAVGDKLFDNPNTFIELESPEITSFVHSYDDPVPEEAEPYVERRAGPYTFASQTSAFFNTIKHSNGDVVGLQGTIDTAGYNEYTSNHTITLNIYGTSGLKSTGRVQLDENFVPGPSQETYYSHPRDAQDIATFIRSIFDALPASSLTPLNIAQNATHAEIVEYITTPSAYAVGQVNHWSSSCRFGKCVDENTKVIGTRNIFVVDGSIVPPLSVNPQFGIMVAAERASELILRL